MPEQLQVRLPDGVRLHVEAHGPAGAPATVVLIHGWTLDARIWHRQVRDLRARMGDRVRIVTYDARGHGRSGPTRLNAATLAQLGDDLAAVVDQVAPTGPVVFCGHSMGGMTILEYAHRHPEDFAARTAGLVLVSTTAEGHTHTAYGLPPRLARIVRMAETTGAVVLARCGSLRAPHTLLRVLRPSLRWLLFGDPCDPADVRLAASAVAHASLCSIGGLRETIGTQHRLDTLPNLAGLPVAVLVGDRDRLTPPRCAESIVQALPDTHLTVCRDAGHMLMMERPAEVTESLVTVLHRAGVGRPVARVGNAWSNRADAGRSPLRGRAVRVPRPVRAVRTAQRV